MPNEKLSLIDSASQLQADQLPDHASLYETFIQNPVNASGDAIEPSFVNFIAQYPELKPKSDAELKKFFPSDDKDWSDFAGEQYNFYTTSMVKAVGEEAKAVQAEAEANYQLADSRSINIRRWMERRAKGEVTSADPHIQAFTAGIQKILTEDNFKRVKAKKKEITSAGKKTYSTEGSDDNNLTLEIFKQKKMNLYLAIYCDNLSSADRAFYVARAFNLLNSKSKAFFSEEEINKFERINNYINSDEVEEKNRALKSIKNRLYKLSLDNLASKFIEQAEAIGSEQEQNPEKVQRQERRNKLIKEHTEKAKKYNSKKAEEFEKKLKSKKEKKVLYVLYKNLDKLSDFINQTDKSEPGMIEADILSNIRSLIAEVKGVVREENLETTLENLLNLLNNIEKYNKFPYDQKFVNLIETKVLNESDKDIQKRLTQMVKMKLKEIEHLDKELDKPQLSLFNVFKKGQSIETSLSARKEKPAESSTSKEKLSTDSNFSEKNPKTLTRAQTVFRFSESGSPYSSCASSGSSSRSSSPSKTSSDEDNNSTPKRSRLQASNRG